MDHMVITPVWAKRIIPRKRDGNEDTSPRRFRWGIVRVFEAPGIRR
jgi:hypothetical protein